MTRGPRFALLSILLPLAAITAACGGNRHGDAVAILGDSITAFDQSGLHRELAEFDLVVSGHPGATAAETIPPTEFLAGRTYDQVIINVGSNDALGELPAEETRSAVEQLVRLLDGTECIHLVNVNEHMTNLASGATVTEAARSINEVIDGIADTHDGVGVVDWRSETEQTLNDEDPPQSTLTEDSIHPNDEGNARLEDLYRAALNGCGSLL